MAVVLRHVFTTLQCTSNDGKVMEMIYNIPDDVYKTDAPFMLTFFHRG